MAPLEPSDRLLETSCGSPHYASPEIVAVSCPRSRDAQYPDEEQGMSYHGAASDIWSCGVILFALLTGRLPFDDENIRVLLKKVKNGRFSMPADLPADTNDLITRMLVVDDKRRISVSLPKCVRTKLISIKMADIMQHQFIQRRQNTDSGRRLLVGEHSRRSLGLSSRRGTSTGISCAT